VLVVPVDVDVGGNVIGFGTGTGDVDVDMVECVFDVHMPRTRRWMRRSR